MITLGIDPGWSGGVAVIEDGNVLFTRKMGPDVGAIHDDFRHIFIRYQVHTVAAEVVGGRKGDGAKQAFSFGYNYGAIMSTLHIASRKNEFLTIHVDPKEWQPVMGVYNLTYEDGTKMRKTDKKNKHKFVCSELFPDYPKTKITHAVADALLIAKFGENCVKNIC